MTHGGSHPQPQFRRANWASLDGDWDFALDAQAQWRRPEEIAWQGTIRVPFAPETPASGVNHNGFFKACWYRKPLAIPARRPGQRVILHFGAVDHEASVWVNHRLVARHEGGYTPFHCDITDDLLEHGQAENSLVVRAYDDPHDLTQPRGKQDWQLEPHSIWYPRTTGIWQSVWIEVTGPSWLEALSWDCNLSRYEIEIDALVARSREGLRLRVKLDIEGRLLADDTYAVVLGEVRRRIALSDPGIDDYRNQTLWSPSRPVLIQATIELLDEAGAVLDAVQSYTAMRSVEVLGERLMLNGRPIFLRMVLDQGYWPESGLTPPDDDAARRDVELIKAMGFNGVRAHQRVSDPRFLHWADVLGLLVWDEMPSPYRFRPRTVARLTAEWMEVIQRDRGHPCVIVWVPINESWGVPDLPSNPAHVHMIRLMYHLTHALDPSRPVVGNDGWEMDLTDIITIHDYERLPERLRKRYEERHEIARILRTERPGGRVLLLNEEAYRGQPIMITEFGGVSLRKDGSWGYAEVTTEAEFEARYKDLLGAVNNLPLLAGFCYTQFADTYQEANGLVRADRTPKFPIQRIASITRGDVA